MIQKKNNNGVLWWAGLGFAVMLGAWTTFFVVAAHYRVPEVPVVTQTPVQAR